MKILVVDDEQLLVKGMKFNLENEGYTVETAYDGATAIDMGPDGGEDGGRIVACGSQDDIRGYKESVTGRFI